MESSSSSSAAAAAAVASASMILAELRRQSQQLGERDALLFNTLEQRQIQRDQERDENARQDSAALEQNVNSWLAQLMGNYQTTVMTKLSSIKEAQTAAMTELSSIKEAQTAAMTELSSIKEAQTAAMTELSSIKEAQTTVMGELSSIKAAVKENTAKLSSLEQTMESVQTTVGSVEETGKETKTKLAAIRAIVGKNELTCNQTKDSIASFETKLAVLEERVPVPSEAEINEMEAQIRSYTQARIDDADDDNEEEGEEEDTEKENDEDDNKEDKNKNEDVYEAVDEDNGENKLNDTLCTATMNDESFECFSPIGYVDDDDDDGKGNGNGNGDNDNDNDNDKVVVPTKTTRSTVQNNNENNNKRLRRCAATTTTTTTTSASRNQSTLTALPPQNKSGNSETLAVADGVVVDCNNRGNPESTLMALTSTKKKTIVSKADMTADLTTTAADEPSARFDLPKMLYKMLEECTFDGEFSKIVSWQPHGLAFKVHKREELEAILPNWFKEKYESWCCFLRQWGFLKLRRGKDRDCWYHKNFVYESTIVHSRNKYEQMSNQDFSEGMPKYLSPGKEPDLDKLSTLDNKISPKQRKRKAGAF